MTKKTRKIAYRSARNSFTISWSVSSKRKGGWSGKGQRAQKKRNKRKTYRHRGGIASS
jgi:hypothetical protein